MSRSNPSTHCYVRPKTSTCPMTCWSLNLLRFLPSNKGLCKYSLIQCIYRHHSLFTCINLTADGFGCNGYSLNISSSRERAAASAANAATGPHREAWSNKSSAYADLYTQNVVISMEEQEEQLKQAAEGKAVKERPVWLTQSTIQGAYSETDLLKNRKWEFLVKQPVITCQMYFPYICQPKSDF